MFHNFSNFYIVFLGLVMVLHGFSSFITEGGGGRSLPQKSGKFMFCFKNMNPFFKFYSLWTQYVLDVGRCYGNASTRKCLKKKRKPLKKQVFLRRFRNFCKKNGNPSKPSF